jgi:hypothetical protein
MKMLAILSLLFIVVACSKDNRYSRKLEGDWKLVKKETNGQAVDLTGLSVVLECGDCMSANIGCYGYYREKTAQPNNTSSTVVLPMETKFSDNGKTMTIDYDFGTSIEVYEVLNITRKELKIKLKGSENVYYFEAI